MQRIAFLLLALSTAACGAAAGTPAAPAAPMAPAEPMASPPITAGPEWDPLRPLLGSWEGADAATQSTGRFTLEPDLGGKVLVRRNSNATPKGVHEDLMIIFQAPSGLRATYFDNEGHVIQYAVAASPNRVELLSDEVPNMPRFRLTYDVKSAGELAIEFAIAMPGTTEFKHYTGGTVRRVPPATKR